MLESTPIPEGYKQCTKGAHVKPLSEFGKKREKTGSYRLRSWCKACVNAASKDRYDTDPAWRAHHKTLRDRWRAQNPTYAAEYYQENRERMIAAAIEYERRNPKDPELRRQWEREWRQTNADRLREASRLWRENNLESVREAGARTARRRRAHMRTLPVEPYTMAQIVERDGDLCVLCDEPINWSAACPDPLSATVEHLECIAWQNSAGDVLSNVALAHRRCNEKRNKYPHPAAARKRAELLAVERVTEPA